MSEIIKEVWEDWRAEIVFGSVFILFIAWIIWAIVTYADRQKEWDKSRYEACLQVDGMTDRECYILHYTNQRL